MKAKIDNEANFRRLWKLLANVSYNIDFDSFKEIVNYKIDFAMDLDVFNHRISNDAMAACPACYEAYRRAKISMQTENRWPCSKCPLDWGDDHCEKGGTIYTKWKCALTPKKARKYALLISKMEWEK